MKKKLLALAVAGAIAPAVVLADASSVTLYGTLNADFENVKADESVARRNRVSSNSSNFGIRGAEDLGGGLKAIFQIESAIGIDGSASTLAGRNTNLGLTGNWGTAFLGQWDTPYKVSTGRLDPFGNVGIAAYTGIMGGGSSVTAANGFDGAAATSLTGFRNATSFDRRQKNSVQYWTPNLAGFSARVAYSANEERSSALDLNPNLWSVSGVYENGPLYVGLALERHNDYGIEGKDDGGKIFGSYTFGGTTIGLIAERLKYKPSGLPETQVDEYFASVAHKMGPHTFRLAYGHRTDIEFDGDDIPDTRSRQISVGYGYSLSKRTEVYALYTRIRNDENAVQDFSANAVGGTSFIAPGADPRGFGVGIRHTF